MERTFRAYNGEAVPMPEFTPITDELLARARTDRGLRRRLVSEHLDRLMVLMSEARHLAATNSRTTQYLEEGARLAVELSKILKDIDGQPNQ
jgi:hypothetical protein